MRVRGARKFKCASDDLPDYEVAQIDRIFEADVKRADKTVWIVLGLVRRHGGSKKLLDEIKALPDREKLRLVRLGNRWLSGPELTAFKTKLDSIHDGKVGIYNVKIPFGKVRAVQEVTKSALRDLL